MGSRFLGLVRLTVYAGVTLALMPVQWFLVRRNHPGRRSLPLRYHSLCCRILGLEIRTQGRPSGQRPTLFVSNHTSYLDITILGALIPGSFIAKRDVGRWPFFGTLARLQRTVFVDRRARNARHDKESLHQRLAGGDQMILFPEGTSSDGNRTLPFKSALFAVAALRPIETGPAITVQPVSILPTHLDGIALGRDFRSLYAWYGDMDLLPHLWSIAGMGRIEVAVIFHDPVTLDDFGGRKALADHCWRQVADGVGALATGRELRPEPYPEPGDSRAVA